MYVGLIIYFAFSVFITGLSAQEIIRDHKTNIETIFVFLGCIFLSPIIALYYILKEALKHTFIVGAPQFYYCLFFTDKYKVLFERIDEVEKIRNDWWWNHQVKLTKRKYDETQDKMA